MYYHQPKITDISMLNSSLELNNTIVNIRNRLVHDGSFDFMQMVYDCYDGPNGHSEGTILFPDMENGLFVTSKNRKNFYS